MERLNKEYDININNYVRMKYGSINRLNPIVVYINGKSWIAPTFEGDYEELITKIFNSFKKELKSQVNSSPYFDNKIVCDFDLKTSSLKENKKNFLSFEFYIKQKRNVIQLKDMKLLIKNTFKGAIDKLVDNLINNSFIMTKDK